MSRMTRIIPSFVALLLLAGAILHVQAVEPGNEHFERRWSRTDEPVANGATARTWIWGPSANTGVIEEEYAESPGGTRQVQYYDKSRMEINDPSGDPASPFFVTNGLLVIELMTGQLQLGDNTFEQHAPAQVNVAGDPDDPLTYADLAPLRIAAPVADGSAITQTIDGNGTVDDNPALASYGVTAAHRLSVPGIDHQVASVFWDFLNSTGPVVLAGQQATERLFDPWFYATGFPVTEAYWANVKVAGTPRLVLLQCFERRCLTYTPGNPDGFQVEAGNVGQHYRTWRYEQIPGDGTPTATATGTATATSTATVTATNTPTNTSTPTATPTQEPSTEYTYAGEWGGVYTPIVPLNIPTGVTLDRDNHVWVADAINDRLVQFDEHGRFLRSAGSKGTAVGEFKYPTGVAATQYGRLYVTDSQNNRIQVLNEEGLYITHWGGEGTENGKFRDPRAIGINNEIVYVAEVGNQRVQMFDLNGTYLGQFGSAGTGPGQFDRPLAIAFYRDYVYVVEYGNHRVQKFGPNGAYINQFGSFGTANGQFNYPKGIYVAEDGFIYVADGGNDRIQVFTPEGNFLGILGEPGDGFGQFNDPGGMALDNEGNFYVTDVLNGRVQKYDAEGHFRFDVWDSRRGSLGAVTDIAFDHTGNLLVIDGHDDIPTITAYTPDGVPLETFGRTRSGLGQYDVLRGVAMGVNGDIYVTDKYSNRVQRFSSAWVYKGEWGTTGTLPGQFNGPTKVATDADGNVYVADTGNNRVQKFDSNGVFLDAWGGAGSGNGQFKTPEGIAIDGERVYVTDYGNDRVQVFTRDGQYLDQWGSTGSELGQLKSPVGVAVRPDGYVLVVDYGNSRVVVFTPDGEAVDTFGTAGSGPGQFNVPFGIAIDDDGYVYVTDINNHRVQKFKPE